MMTVVAKVVLILFGLFTIAGGVMGFVNANSKASLIAGGISGLILIAAGILIQVQMVTPGLITGLVVSLALLGRFLPAFIKTQKMMPAGITSFLAIAAGLVCVAALVKK